VNIIKFEMEVEYVVFTSRETRSPSDFPNDYNLKIHNSQGQSIGSRAHHESIRGLALSVKEDPELEEYGFDNSCITTIDAPLVKGGLILQSVSVENLLEFRRVLLE
jgi:hypothetical protein